MDHEHEAHGDADRAPEQVDDAVPEADATLIDNTSANPTLGAFANGDSLTADYGGVTYRFGIDTAGGAGGNDVMLQARPLGSMLLVR